MHIERANADGLVINQLPDGSKVITDRANETVFALNSTAGAAWDACSTPTTLSVIRENMRHSIGSGVSEELAEEAILQLQKNKLVTATGSFSQATRREFLASLTAAALPLVVSLTVAEQQAFAKKTRSVPRPDPDPKPHS